MFSLTLFIFTIFIIASIFMIVSSFLSILVLFRSWLQKMQTFTDWSGFGS